jgi:hypothetical protein
MYKNQYRISHLSHVLVSYSIHCFYASNYFFFFKCKIFYKNIYLENNNTAAAEMITNDSSSRFRRLHLKENTIAADMTSTVIVNNARLGQQQRPSNKDETIAKVNYLN